MKIEITTDYGARTWTCTCGKSARCTTADAARDGAHRHLVAHEQAERSVSE